MAGSGLSMAAVSDREEKTMTVTSPMENLEGKVALVTGASRRIGRSTALGLARHGADVVIMARAARDEIEAVAGEIRTLGRKATVVMGDVASEADVARMVEEVGAATGKTDILVNNAAIRRQAPFLDMTLAEWREINAVILDGAFLMSRAVLPVMLQNGGGTIVSMCLPHARFMTGQTAHISGGLYMP